MNSQKTDSHSICGRPEIAGLPPVNQWRKPQLTVLDCGRPVDFHILDAINYHGLDSIGGVVLGFRLLQRAFAELSPNGPAERRGLSLFTSFPGFGARDAFELVTRMVTDRRYTVDPSFIDGRASDGVAGRCYFRFSLAGRQIILSPPPNIPDPIFIKLGRDSKKISPQAPDYQKLMNDWTNAKFGLATLLLGLDCQDALRILEP